MYQGLLSHSARNILPRSLYLILYIEYITHTYIYIHISGLALSIIFDQATNKGSSFNARSTNCSLIFVTVSRLGKGMKDTCVRVYIQYILIFVTVSRLGKGMKDICVYVYIYIYVYTDICDCIPARQRY